MHLFISATKGWAAEPGVATVVIVAVKIATAEVDLINLSVDAVVGAKCANTTIA